MRRFRFAYLLVALVLVAFARPFLTEPAPGITLIDLLLFITLISGAYAVIEHKHLFALVAAFGLTSAATQITHTLSPSPTAASFYLGATLLFYVSVTGSAVRSLFGIHAEVTHDTICQAVSVYLLLGMIGAMAYALLELIAPGSFRFLEMTAEDQVRFDRFLGFSFTTLTTLGYGNVAPATPRADALTTLQAVCGQFYLAIVIARLVAIQIGQNARLSEMRREN